MVVMLCMVLGILGGYFCIPKKGDKQFAKKNSVTQMICVGVLIFSMGVLLGSNEEFWQEMKSLGWKSFMLALLPTLGSILLVYPLSQRFLVRPSQEESEKSC